MEENTNEETDINDLKALDLTKAPNGEGWNGSIVAALEEQMAQCRTYELQHRRAASRYSLFYKITENIVTVIQVLATGSALTDLLGPQSMLLWARILTFLLSGMSIFALKFHSRENYMSRSERHREAISRWVDLYNEIDTHLRLDMKDRLNAKVFKYLINDKFTKLLKESPAIPSAVSHIGAPSPPQDGPIRPIQVAIEPPNEAPNAKLKYELDRYLVENLR